MADKIIYKLTDDEIASDAERAAQITAHTMKKMRLLLQTHEHNSPDVARAMENTITQTVALEVARPTVRVNGGELDRVGCIRDEVTVAGSGYARGD